MKNKHEIENRVKVVKQLALIALGGISYFVIIIIALHFLRPDHNPIMQTTSQYAVGPYGYLMTTAFFSVSLASLVLVVELYREIPSPVRSRIGLGLLGIWGVGVLIAMIFPVNVDGTPITTSGIVHRINGPLAFLSLTFGTVLVSRSFKQDENFRPIQRPALILSWLMLAMLMATFLNIATESGFTGLSQRAFLSIFVIWFCLIAVRILAVANRGKGEID